MVENGHVEIIPTGREDEGGWTEEKGIGRRTGGGEGGQSGPAADA